MKTRLKLAGAALSIGMFMAAGYFGVAGRGVAAEDPAPGNTDKPAAASESQTTPASPAPRPINRELTLGGKPPAASDTLLLHYPDDPDTVNPLTANDVTSEDFQRLVYESLAERNDANPDKWDPVLAESWSYDPQKMEYTFHLRKGVKWQPITLPNGTELPSTEMTARDVKFTFDVILNKNVDAPQFRNSYEDPQTHESNIVVTLVPHDKYTVKVRWLKPYFLAEDVTLGAAVIPRHVFSVDKDGKSFSRDYSSKEFADGFNKHWANLQMCGTGPMIFKKWVRDQKVVLERNPDYWGVPFYFSHVEFLSIANPNTALQKTLQNELDWIEIREKDLYFENLKHKNVVDGKVELKTANYPAYRYIGYNETRNFFKDKRVRWAMGHAIPVDEIIATIYHGLATRVTGPFLPGSPSNDTSLAPVDYDLDKARALLDEAGWKLAEGDSVRSKMIDGVKVDAAFDLMFRAESPTFDSIGEVIKENCRKIGVRVRLSATKWAALLDKTRSKEFDAVLVGWAMAWKDDPYPLWDSSQADVKQSQNYISYANPDVDKLIAALRVTMERPKQIEIYRQIHRLLYEDQPYTFLFQEKFTVGYDARLQNVRFYPIRPCIDDREWYSTKPRALAE